MIALIDYGMGNLASVSKACDFLGTPVRTTSDPKVVRKAEAVIFPGVGAFGPAMRELRARGLVDPIVGSIQEGKPFLGLCLGLQLLFEESEESPGVKGLRIIPGRVRRLPMRGKLKVPHMGWNQIQRSSPPSMSSPTRSGIPLFRGTLDGGLQRGSDSRFRENDILTGIPDGAFMYFVHSYYADPAEVSCVAASTEYGQRFPSILWNGTSLWATQFHPEKSQKWGLRILKNFLKVASSC